MPFSVASPHVTRELFSPEGERIVTPGVGAEIEIWSVGEDHPIRVLPGYSGWIESCVLSPDGHLVASSSDDHSIRVWDVDTGDVLTRIEPLHEETALFDGSVTRPVCLAFSADGQLLAADYEGLAPRVWRARSGELVARLDSRGDPSGRFGGGPVFCAFSPDGRHVVTCDKSRFYVWDVDRGQRLSDVPRHGSRACSFSPDGELIATCGSEGRSRLWQVTDGSRVAALSGQSGNQTSCCFSPDGQRIAITSADGSLVVWRTEAALSIADNVDRQGYVTSCAFSPDESKLVSGAKDGTAVVWDVHSGARLATLKGHDGAVTVCLFTPCSGRVVTASEDGTVKIWNANGGDALVTCRGHSFAVTACALSPGGRYLASASDDSTIRIWDRQAGDWSTKLFSGYEHDASTDFLAFSPDVSRLVAQTGGSIRVWQTGGEPEYVALLSDSGEIICAAFSPDGGFLVSGSDRGEVTLWDPIRGAFSRQLGEHSGAVNDCAVSPNGRHVLTASKDDTLVLWSVDESVAPQRLSSLFGTPTACAFAPDGRHAVSVLRGGLIEVWDLEKEEVVARYATAGSVECMATAQGTTAVGDSAGMFHILAWVNFPSTERPLDPVRPSQERCPGLERNPRVLSFQFKRDDYLDPSWLAEGSLYDVGFCSLSPDGKRLVAVSHGSLVVWNTRTGDRAFQLSDVQCYTWGVEPGAVSADCRHVAVFLGDHLEVISLNDGQTTFRKPAVPPTDPPLEFPFSFTPRCAFSPDGRWVVAPRDNQTIEVRATITGDIVAPLTVHDDPLRLTECSFTGDGRRIIAISGHKILRVWNVATREVLLEVPLEGAFAHGSFPDGERVVLTPRSGPPYIWNLESKAETTRLCDWPQFAQPASFSFSRDGRLVAAGTNNGEVGVWTVADGRLVGRTMWHGGSVIDLSFSPDSLRLLTVSTVKTLRVWDVDRSAAVAEFVGELWDAPMKRKLGYSFAKASATGLYEANTFRVVATCRDGHLAVGASDGTVWFATWA